MYEIKIFIYGTLIKNFRNYNKYLKSKVTSITVAYIYGKLYHLKIHNCPAIIDGKDKVYGQVIAFNDDAEYTLLKTIDNFEKYFFDRDEIIYERKPVDIYYPDNNKKERLSFYKLVNRDVLKSENAEYISSENWERYLKFQKNKML